MPDPPRKRIANRFCAIFVFMTKSAHPKDMGAQEIERFLSHPAANENVAAATQKQALNALVFLYRDVFLIPLDGSIAPILSKRKRHPPTVCTEDEIERIFN